MNLFFRTFWIVAGTVLMLCLPVLGFAAFTPGPLVVSPAEVDLGTLRMPAGAEPETYQFPVSVTGGPTPLPVPEGSNEKEATATFVASCNAHWLSLEPSDGDVPGAIVVTATITDNMESGVWKGDITISSGLDPNTEPVTVPVSINVVQSIGDLFTVSPNKLDIRMTEKNLHQQTFPVTIANADPNQSTGYRWSAHSDVIWLELSADEGSGDAEIGLKVDPDYFFLNNDTDGDGIPDTATGTIIFRSSLNALNDTENANEGEIEKTDRIHILTVNVKILPDAQTPSVAPSQLYWTVETSTTNTATESTNITTESTNTTTESTNTTTESTNTTTAELSFPAQRIQVFGFESGWTASCDMGFVSALLYGAAGEEPEGELGPVIVTSSYGWVEVTPNADLLGAMGPGTYVGYVTVSDLDKTTRIQVPITINIRKSGEAVTLPVAEFNNAYSQMAVAESSIINVTIPIPEDIAYYNTAETCQAAGGIWIPGVSLMDNVGAHCSRNEHAYLLLERQDMEPGMVYAMTQDGTLSLAYRNGIKVAGANALSYANGPVSDVTLGPLQMNGSYGTVVVSLRVGTDLSSAVETQHLEIALQTPEGQWTITDTYAGEYYTYATPLSIDRIDDGIQTTGYTASWENMPVSVAYGDGTNGLYQLSFEQSGINYTYQVQSISGNHMTGQWRYSWQGVSSDWEDFTGQRKVWQQQLVFPSK